MYADYELLVSNVSGCFLDNYAYRFLENWTKTTMIRLLYYFMYKNTRNNNYCIVQLLYLSIAQYCTFAMFQCIPHMQKYFVTLPYYTIPQVTQVCH